MLFPIKKILVCTDLSDHSDEVLKSAEAVRQRVNGELSVLYVSDIGLHLEWASDKSRQETFYKTFIGSIADDLTEKMKAQIQRTGANAKLFLRQGVIVDQICQTIMENDEKYDLLIIGHSSKTTLFHHLIGNVARKLVSSVSIPTLVIKKPIEFNKIAGLIDERGSSNWMITSTLDFFRTLTFKEVEFISLWHDRPEFFNQDESMTDFKDNLMDDIKYFTRDGEKVIVRVEATHDLQIAHQLAQLIEEDKVSLAMMKRNRGKKLNKLLLGSETLRMLELESINILVMPV